MEKWVLILLMVPFVYAADYNVAQDGSGDFTSIQEAAEVATAGDTVHIHAGTYSAFSPSNSGTAGNFITFRNFENDVVTINAQGDSAISVQGKNYVQFIGLNLNGGSTASFYVEGPASNIIADGLSMGGGYKGIQFMAQSTISDSTIHNCEITDTQDTCINLYNHVEDILVDNNTLSYCAVDRSGDENDGIQVNVWDYEYNGHGPDGITISNNDVGYAGRQGLMTWNAINLHVKDNHFHHCGASGIQIEDGAVNVVVDGNVNEHNAQHYETETGVWIDNTENAVVQNNILRHNKIGLLISKSDQVIARNNIVYENDASPQDPCGITAVKYDGVSNTNSIIVHNTVYANGQGSNHGGGISLGAWGIMESAIVKNNIMSESNSESDLYLKCNDYVSDYNNIYNAGSLSVNVNDNTMSWEQYKSQTGQDSNSIIQNPLFLDPLSGDFFLQSGSPCIDAGGPLTTTIGSGSGTSLSVEDARYFTDGFGIIDGDMIQVGSNDPVRVTAVNYNSNTLTLSQSINWNSGDAVNYAYSGNGPDMGALESGFSSQPVCGNGNCEAGEDINNCPEDCSVCMDLCGNGICEEIVCQAIGCPCSETCQSCPQDCCCVHEAEQQPCDGCVDTTELSDYINEWKVGRESINDLMTVINLWKQGC